MIDVPRSPTRPRDAVITEIREVSMARRAGKATSRKARQRNVPRPPRTAPPSRSASPIEPQAIPPVGTPDAREAASLTPPRRMTPVIAGSGRSQLSSHDRAEYHYVERDLRSIAILTGIMAALLLLAWFVFVALDLFR
jgi:hypothetical protein